MHVRYPPQLFDIGNVEAHLINPGDTVKLAMLRGPDEVHDASVFLEIRQPGGTQRPNSHSKSVETFLFLRGTGKAYCDEFELDVRAGQLLVLPAGSMHRIESSTDGKLYAITTMAPDDGFAALVSRGETAPLDDEERGRAGAARAQLTNPVPPHTNLRAWGCFAGHEFVDVPIRALKVLPGRARLAKKLDAAGQQLLARRCQVIHGEPGHGAGLEVVSPVGPERKLRQETRPGGRTPSNQARCGREEAGARPGRKRRVPPPDRSSCPAIRAERRSWARG